MSESSIARRYAKAFLEIAREEGNVEPYLLELETFQKSLVVSPELLKILENRFLSVASRMALIDEIGGRLSLSPLVNRFIKFLIRKGRISIFRFVASAYRRQAYVLQNKAEAVVTTAFPLSDLAYGEIQKILEGATKKS